ncbi:MAG: glycosyltransferase family 2 protein [Candidatus Aminicenantales bacterium]
MKITAAVITRNEEKRLEPALKSVAEVADEIVVVDSYSDDETLKIARRYNCRIFHRKWKDYADQKNYASSRARHPWIFSLDADERISPELKAEILSLKDRDHSYSGFSIPVSNYYLGKWIRHTGWYAARQIRLFLKERAHWEGESINETLVIEGEVGKLRGKIHHFAFRSISNELKRMDKYSGLEAKKLYTAGKKCRLFHLLFSPFSGFMKVYFFRLGFLDGFAGLVISVFNGYERFIRYAKLREIWHKGERIEPFPY